MRSSIAEADNSPAGKASRVRLPRAARQREQGEDDSLDFLLASLRGLPPLSPERIAQLAKEIREHESHFREAIYEIPGTADLVIEQWNERRAGGRVTGLLSHHYCDRPDEAWSDFIDEKLRDLSGLVSRREALGAVDSPDQSARIASEITAVLAAAEILFEVLQDISVAMRRGLDRRRSRLANGEWHQLGLDGARARRALERAERALRARKDARKTITSHNLRLVVHVAKRYRGPGVAFSDLIQDGCIGLMRAVDKFDASLGYRFSTYAVWWIEQAVIRAIQSSSRTVRVPSHMYEANLRLKDSERKLRLHLGEPTRSDLANDLDLDETQLELLLSSQRPIQSLEKPMDDSEGPSLADRLRDPGEIEPEELLDRNQLRAVLTQGLVRLLPRERQVLTWRFGLKGSEELSLQEIGDRMKLSRERIRQIQNGAFAKLRRQKGLRDLRVLISE